ncbi:DUF6338 family protein [Streptomyces fuscichromogenes]|uniref:Uncharacterized protein n=1 Tax=Streptomyces fuscichromogenes TaxID=1324013 RepID=A0A918CVK4_9ACTN|nr:DUF6338 family protein [Streptomyces fuscichromogenes]GGN35394.1 hypothetical protein GCM10011578_077370 [Streptomyces fuscichromogenes]
MPTNVAGLVLLITLALPGYVYHRAVDRHVPERVHTAFQEVLSILFVSVAVDVAVIALFMSGSAYGLWYGPDLSALLDRPGAYGLRHFSELVPWGATALLTPIDGLGRAQ